jgi:hypothetical protein
MLVPKCKYELKNSKNKKITFIPKLNKLIPKENIKKQLVGLIYSLHP